MPFVELREVTSVNVTPGAAQRLPASCRSQRARQMRATLPALRA